MIHWIASLIHGDLPHSGILGGFTSQVTIMPGCNNYFSPTFQNSFTHLLLVSLCSPSLPQAPWSLHSLLFLSLLLLVVKLAINHTSATYLHTQLSPSLLELLSCTLIYFSSSTVHLVDPPNCLSLKLLAAYDQGHPLFTPANININVLYIHLYSYFHLLFLNCITINLG